MHNVRSSIDYIDAFVIYLCAISDSSELQNLAAVQSASVSTQTDDSTFNTAGIDKVHIYVSTCCSYHSNCKLRNIKDKDVCMHMFTLQFSNIISNIHKSTYLSYFKM